MAYETVLTTAGCTWIVDKLDSTVSTTAKYIGWGTGTTEADIGDTAIEGESAEARVEATITQPTTTKIRWTGTLTSASAQTIANAGNITTASGAGTLVVHANFGGITLAIGDSITFTIELQIS